jgi:hypothetical protein
MPGENCERANYEESMSQVHRIREGSKSIYTQMDHIGSCVTTEIHKCELMGHHAGYGNFGAGVARYALPLPRVWLMQPSSLINAHLQLLKGTPVLPPYVREHLITLSNAKTKGNQ